jgi:hypothetical protein
MSALFQQVARHRIAHDAQAQECNLCHVFLLWLRFA